MSIKFASICPHPPIIIPTIGSSSDLGRASKTIKAMEKSAEVFAKAQPETVIIVSPHGPINYHEMTITMSPTLFGNFQMFGDSETELNFENDLEIVSLLQEKCAPPHQKFGSEGKPPLPTDRCGGKEQKIPVRIIDFSQLDHGCLVPLYYLTKNYTPQKGKILKVVPIAYSYLNLKTHFEFGKKIFEVCNIEGKTKDKKIAIIASGDLSHRLSLTAPDGFSLKGVEFDEKLIKLLKSNDFEGILNMESDLIKEAGECGYLSIIILLGILSEIKKAKFKFLSYQKPFGVGYLVANVKL